MSDRKALIRRWNKYHPINCEVARHIRVLEQQGERSGGAGTREMLDVLALCLWAVEGPRNSKQGGGLDDSDGGGMWLSIDSRLHPRHP